jgi:hypothetical protein
MKWLSVVALVLLVLTGAMGLRNVSVANAAVMSSMHSSTPAIWANGPGPFPPPLPTGGAHVRANGPGPFPPPLPTGGAHIRANGPGPFPPPLPTGGAH